MQERIISGLNNDGRKGRKLPIGSGSKTEGYEKLPAVHVKNEVVWVNPDLKLPFKLKEGEDADIGVFLIQNPGMDEPSMAIGAMPSHRRSGLLGRVIFEDNKGRLYRDIDLKGLGLSSLDHYGSGKIEVLPPRIKNKEDTEKALGIADINSVEYDTNLTEILLENGFRTQRIIAIIKLKEIVSGNEKITIEEAKKRGILPKEIEPVVEVRAFGTKARLGDLYTYDFFTGRIHIFRDRDLLVKDAKALVAQELGKNEKEFSDSEYLDWFLETLGEQIALLHNAGYYHAYLSPHNITLDCRVVDLDSVGSLPLESPKEREELTEKDFADAAKSVEALIEGLSIPRIKNKGGEVNEKFKKLKLKFSESYLKHVRKNI